MNKIRVLDVTNLNFSTTGGRHTDANTLCNHTDKEENGLSETRKESIDSSFFFEKRNAIFPETYLDNESHFLHDSPAKEQVMFPIFSNCQDHQLFESSPALSEIYAKSCCELLTESFEELPGTLALVFLVLF